MMTMDALIAGFSKQIEEALTISSAYSYKLPKDTVFANIVISGLGGSGIGGSIIQNYALHTVSKPIFVNKTYDLPKFANQQTLVIICSYSGNTEETVEALHQAIANNCKIVCITSGGAVQSIADQHQLDCILIPSGFPPRSCLGYSLVQLFGVFHYFNLIDASFIADFKEAIALLDTEEEAIKAYTKNLASALADKLPILYIENDMEGVGVRWRQQLNENAKMLAWHHVIPEMNHNELVGWRTKDNSKAVVFLRNETDHVRSQSRMKLNRTTIQDYSATIVDIFSKGNSYVARAVYLIHLGDWLSWYLAQERNFDATEVEVIDKLKSSLAN
mgnify:CR=1 FL=1